MALQIKRVYAPPAQGEGRRILVDRLWPRGIPKAALKDVPWLREIAPSSVLREWFWHQPAKWMALRHRYFAELDVNPEAVVALRALAGQGRITLRNTAHNHAVALRDDLLR